MPKKIRELKKLLSQAGFYSIPAKGSHSKWIHPKLFRKIVIAGKDGNDAKSYLEKQVAEALEDLARLETDDSENLSE